LVEKKEVCSSCGLPKGIGKGNVWHPNGVITASYPPHIRGTLYDIEELNALFPALSERMGYDITRLVMEGKRKDGKRYADELIRNRKAAGKDTSPMTIYNMISRFTAYWGLGLAEAVEYQEGERLTFKVKNAYSDPMSRGDWAGVFEAVEHTRGEATWRDESKKDLLDIVAVEGEPELEERIEQEMELGIPYSEEGDLEYQLCPECGVPLEISRQFKWNADDSMVVEIISGKRFVLHNTNGIVAVTRVLHEELGSEIDDMVTEISRHYSKGYYAGLLEGSSIDAELMKFPLRSWGRVARMHRGEDGYSIRVINPYCSCIVAGRLWGLVEAFDGHTYAVNYLVEEEGYLDVSITNA